MIMYLSEIVCSVNLLCAVAPFNCLLYAVGKCNLACFPAGDIIVCAYFYVLYQRHTSPEVYAESRFLKLPSGFIENLLVLVANVETKLRACCKINACQTAEPYAIAQVYGDVYCLLLQCLLAIVLFCITYFGRTLVVKCCNVDAKPYKRK